MHLSLAETSPLPPRHHPMTGGELKYSEFQASNGQPLYVVQGLLGHVALGEWKCAIAGKVVFLTSLLKLGWAGQDRAVYVDRKKHPDNLHDVDLFFIGGAGATVANRQGVHLNVVMPEKMCMMPSVTAANGTVVPSVIYAASDEDAVSCILNGLDPEPLVRDLKYLEDFWVNREKLWVMTRAGRTSHRDSVDRSLLVSLDGQSRLEARIRRVAACGRPVQVENRFLFPIMREADGGWELSTGDECLWKGAGLSNLFVTGEGVLCLVADEPGAWRVMRGVSFASTLHFGELLGDVAMYSGKLLFHLRDKTGNEFVVYDNEPFRSFPEIDHASLRVFEGKPVYAAKTIRGGGSWHLVYDNEIINHACDRILEIEAVPKTLRACVLRDNQLVTETYQI